MKAIVLAAGFGTRLRPLTDTVPKPLLNVGGRPIIDYLIANLARVERLNGIVVVTNAVYEQAFESWRSALARPDDITLVCDGCARVGERLGSVGDLALTLDRVGVAEDILVVGGDNLFDLDLREFACFAKQRSGPATVCYDVQDRRLASLYSTVVLDGDRIVSFREKDPSPPNTLVGICVYFYPQSSIPLIRRFISEGNNPDASGNLFQWMVSQVASSAMVFGGHWMDIGTPEEYERAQSEPWPSQQVLTR